MKLPVFLFVVLLLVVISIQPAASAILYSNTTGEISVMNGATITTLQDIEDAVAVPTNVLWNDGTIWYLNGTIRIYSDGWIYLSPDYGVTELRLSHDGNGTSGNAFYKGHFGFDNVTLAGWNYTTNDYETDTTVSRQLEIEWDPSKDMYMKNSNFIHLERIYITAVDNEDYSALPIENVVISEVCGSSGLMLVNWDNGTINNVSVTGNGISGVNGRCDGISIGDMQNGIVSNITVNDAGIYTDEATGHYGLVFDETPFVGSENNIVQDVFINNTCYGGFNVGPTTSNITATNITVNWVGHNGIEATSSAASSPNYLTFTNLNSSNSQNGNNYLLECGNSTFTTLKSYTPVGNHFQIGDDNGRMINVDFEDIYCSGDSDDRGFSAFDSDTITISNFTHVGGGNVIVLTDINTPATNYTLFNCTVDSDAVMWVHDAVTTVVNESDFWKYDIDDGDLVINNPSTDQLTFYVDVADVVGNEAILSVTNGNSFTASGNSSSIIQNSSGYFLTVNNDENVTIILNGVPTPSTSTPPSPTLTLVSTVIDSIDTAFILVGTLLVVLIGVSILILLSQVQLIMSGRVDELNVELSLMAILGLTIGAAIAVIGLAILNGITMGVIS